MKSSASRLFVQALMAFFGVMFGAAAFAQAYPARPIRLINPWPPGGPADAIARPVAERLSQLLGQPIVIESKPGAGAVIGTQYVAKSVAPDGYTLLLSHVGPTTISPAIQKDLSFDPIKDFEHITLVAGLNSVAVVRPELPIKSMPDLIAYAKAHPGQLAYGSVGMGTPTHLALEMLQMMSGIKLLHVTYKGSGSMMQDLVGGRIQFTMIGSAAAEPFIKAGTLRAIATVSSTTRSSMNPELPTVHETLPGYEINTWYGLSAPAGTPAEIVNRLYTETAKVLRDPDVVARLRASGSEPGSGIAPDVFVAKIRRDAAAMKDLVEKLGMQKE
jgi:tripartite-type tricarboxylate transporter receptor subunit TctC